MAENNVQVLIAGAGPTGLALACDLARRGVAFRIIDKSPQPFIGSKGKGLQPRTLEVMDDFGIIEQVLNNGKFHLPFRAYEDGKALGELDMHAGRYPTPNTPYASPLITPQWRTEEALRGLLERSGGKVDQGTELVSIEQNDVSVSATLLHEGREEHIRCDYLVACDGGKSFVRHFLQVPFEGETWKDERMYLGDVRLRGLDREAWHSWAKHPAGWLALCPLPSTDTFQLQAMIPVGEEREPSLELYREIVKERTEGMDIELTEAPWLSLYRVNIRMVSKYRVGRVFLAGDAAHVHSPAGGQGMNTGIQDAYNLGWKLAAVLRGAPDGLLDTYEEERLPVAADVLGISTMLHRTMLSDEEQRVRREAITLQLGITYKERSLSRTSGQSTLKLAAGERAPDARGVNATGDAIRLFDLFRGPHFTLLHLFGAQGASPRLPMQGVRFVNVSQKPVTDAAGAEVFVDTEGHLEAAYGGAGEFALVRPDGYICWIGDRQHLADLQKYFKLVALA
ncbi:FAD-dependent monooxygenase [Silvibacterium acidisoli]|uniref:FAD-dependent monooxygenase n=1 Tax=Acidobacteriaceae bacterium ZG23-2 TaxID=2883246 RepID=UPI00406C9BC4